MGQLISSPADKEKAKSVAITSDEEEEAHDFSGDLPDECLACVFQSLGSGDRKRCSSVCRRWLRIEGLSRNRLSLDAQSNLVTVIPSLFTRYDSVTKLSLRCDRKSVSIGDEALVQISLRCVNLTRLKLGYCREVTDAGMLRFANYCKRLKNLSCRSCAFGARGTNAVLNGCSALEYLSVTRLRGIRDGAAAAASKADQPIGLKSICLKEELYNGPLIFSSKNLQEPKLLFRCSVADRVTKVDMMLQKLCLNDNKITKIPDVSSFKKLLVFALSYNKISSLHGLSKVSNTLKKLYVYKNQIVKMEEIDHFHELQILQLGSNQLRVMDNLQNLTNLQELWLGMNKIRTVNLCGLRCIKKISLIRNRLTSMKGFEDCVALEELYLRRNKITNMEGLSSLVNLHVLDISSNKLTSVNDIENLKGLEDLWLNDNQIESLEGLSEAVAGSREKLAVICLDHNPCAKSAHYTATLKQAFPNIQQIDSETFA